MGAVIGLLFGLWIVGTFLSWPYFWLRRTDRSQSSVERRVTSLMYAAGWPYFAVKFFTDKQARAQEAADIEAQKRRILNGDGPGATPPPGRPETSKIANPFDNA